MKIYIHPDDQSAVWEAIQKAIRTKSVFELEHRIWRVDGTLGWTLSRAIPVLDSDGEITEWFGAANDITARKTAEAEREHLVRELARSNEDSGEFDFRVSERREPFYIQALVTKPAIKAFGKPVLDRPSGPDETQLHAGLHGLSLHSTSDKLAAIV